MRFYSYQALTQNVKSIEFQNESKNTYAFITTSERRPYCNFILTKGVIKPDGSVWILDK